LFGVFEFVGKSRLIQTSPFQFMNVSVIQWTQAFEPDFDPPVRLVWSVDERGSKTFVMDTIAPRESSRNDEHPLSLQKDFVSTTGQALARLHNERRLGEARADVIDAYFPHAKVFAILLYEPISIEQLIANGGVDGHQCWERGKTLLNHTNIDWNWILLRPFTNFTNITKICRTLSCCHLRRIGIVTAESGEPLCVLS
jgi:hypothetical protein